MSATINFRHIDDVTVVDIVGKLTLGDGAVVLREGVKELINTSRNKVILHMGGITYIDPSGIGELVSAFTSVSHIGGKLKLLMVTKRVRDLLEITKLLLVFETFEDEVEAVASFNRP